MVQKPMAHPAALPMILVSLLALVGTSFAFMSAPVVLRSSLGSATGRGCRGWMRRSLGGGGVAPLSCSLGESRPRYRFEGPKSGEIRDDSREGAAGEKRSFMFVPYGERYIKKEGLASKSICADGLVKGTTIQLTHWTNNETPKEFKEDLSTEMCFRFNTMAGWQREWDDAVICNNHFDTDGVMSCHALLHPLEAEEHKDVMISAAAAGDFEEWGMTDTGVMLDIALSKLGDACESDEEAYKVVLPQVSELIEGIYDREDLWGESMDEIRAAEQQVYDGVVSMDLVEDKKNRFIHAGADLGDIGILIHPPGCAKTPGYVLSRLFPWSMGGMGRGVSRILLAYEQKDGTWQYEYRRPGYAWVETTTRPKIPKPDGKVLCERLGGEWTSDYGGGLTQVCGTKSPIKQGPKDVANDLLTLERSLMPRLM